MSAMSDYIPFSENGVIMPDAEDLLNSIDTTDDDHELNVVALKTTLDMMTEEGDKRELRRMVEQFLGGGAQATQNPSEYWASRLETIRDLPESAKSSGSHRGGTNMGDTFERMRARQRSRRLGSATIAGDVRNQSTDVEHYYESLNEVAPSTEGAPTSIPAKPAIVTSETFPDLVSEPGTDRSGVSKERSRQIWLQFTRIRQGYVKEEGDAAKAARDSGPRDETIDDSKQAAKEEEALSHTTDIGPSQDRPLETASDEASKTPTYADILMRVRPSTPDDKETPNLEGRKEEEDGVKLSGETVSEAAALSAAETTTELQSDPSALKGRKEDEDGVKLGRDTVSEAAALCATETTTELQSDPLALEGRKEDKDGVKLGHETVSEAAGLSAAETSPEVQNNPPATTTTTPRSWAGIVAAAPEPSMELTSTSSEATAKSPQLGRVGKQSPREAETTASNASSPAQRLHQDRDSSRRESKASQSREEKLRKMIHGNWRDRM